MKHPSGCRSLDAFTHENASWAATLQLDSEEALDSLDRSVNLLQQLIDIELQK